jgi:hypothetical protein
MASDKKPSMHSGYPDHGKIGSAEELETYGVWVKSEPQDFTASLEAANFNADALPYEADFDTGFDNMGMGADFNLLEPDLHIPEISVDDDGMMADADQGSEEASTQMLMKIAHELSSIRSELNTLKREFAEIRGEAGAESADEDEKIALSGDEMESFFNAADFPTEEEMGFDPGREADEAALKELDAQNEAGEIPEEINIDFENLGIALDGVETAAGEEAPQEELPPLESVVDSDDFEMPSFDALSFDEAPADEASASEPDELEEVPGFAEELVPLEEEEDEELRALRLEGAESLAPPPDNADYLEDDPFALNNADLEGSIEPGSVEPGAALEPSSLDESALSEDLVQEPVLEEPTLEEPVLEEPTLEEPTLEEPALEEPVLEEPTLEEPTLEEPVLEELTLEEPALEEPTPEEPTLEAAAEPAVAETADITLDEVSFDETGFDVGLDDFSTEPAPAEEKPVEEKAADEPVFDTDALELPETAAEEEFEMGAEEPLPDIESLDLSDAVIDEPNLSEEITEPPLEEPALGDISFEDDLSLEMDGFETEVEAKPDEPAAELKLDTPADDQADDSGTLDIGTDLEFDAQDVQIDDLETADLGADLKLDGAADDTGTIDIGEDAALDAQADDLGTVDLGEDIALDTQLDDLGTVDFGADLEPEAAPEPAADLVVPPTKAAGKPDRAPAAPVNDIISDVDDSVIPEGFEVNAKEADPSLDDDLEAFAGELAIAGDDSPADSADKLADDSGEFDAIPAGLKNELKNVLSYMDHLLESLPEEKIEEFAQSEYFDKYKKIFKELGLV